MHNGYVKLWRKSIDSKIWRNPNLWRFWEYCLMKANHKKNTDIVGFQNIELLPGQFIYGRKVASTQTFLSQQTCRTCLKTLEKMGKLTSKTTNKFTIITVVNWGIYQGDEKKSTSKLTNNQPTTNQQLTTNKNVKNVKNVKNKRKRERKFTPPSKTDVENYFAENGYRKEAGSKAFHYYDCADWKDGRGNPVKNWKQKMIAVWMKPENAIDGAKEIHQVDETPKTKQKSVEELIS